MSEEASREITQRELRNDSATIMRRVERGESFTIAAFATAPVLDPDQLRRDLDAAADQDPFNRAW